MLVKAFVKSVIQKENQKGRYGVVEIQTEFPNEFIKFRLFENAMNDGTYDSLKSHEGKEMVIPLEAEVYQGKLQFRIPFDIDYQFRRYVEQPKKVAG